MKSRQDIFLVYRVYGIDRGRKMRQRSSAPRTGASGPSGGFIAVALYRREKQMGRRSVPISPDRYNGSEQPIELQDLPEAMKVTE